MITPGDIVVDINSIPCTGKTIQAVGTFASLNITREIPSEILDGC